MKAHPESPTPELTSERSLVTVYLWCTSYTSNRAYVSLNSFSNGLLIAGISSFGKHFIYVFHLSLGDQKCH